MSEPRSTILAKALNEAAEMFFNQHPPDLVNYRVCRDASIHITALQKQVVFYRERVTK